MDYKKHRKTLLLLFSFIIVIGLFFLFLIRPVEKNRSSYVNKYISDEIMMNTKYDIYQKYFNKNIRDNYNNGSLSTPSIIYPSNENGNLLSFMSVSSNFDSPHENYGSSSSNCIECHKPHDSAGKRLISTQSVNSLCLRCHDGSQSNYNKSDYIIPGVAHNDKGYGCILCHDPHSKDYRMVVIPPPANNQNDLCLYCHNSSYAGFKNDFKKTYAHPLAGSHRDDENYYMLSERHSYCVDCHNPHSATKTISFQGSNLAAGSLKNVSGVRVVLNGVAGMPPTYAVIPEVTYQYELCFKCHSAYSFGYPAPMGKRDVSIDFNFNNESFHPVEALGKNRDIKVEAFVSGSGWNIDSLVKCSECHGSDDSGKNGPHGSTYEHILKKPKPISSNDPFAQGSRTDRNMLCYMCHDYDTYNGNSTVASKYSHPPNHEPALNCNDCHANHGVANYKRLGQGYNSSRDITITIDTNDTASQGTINISGAVSGCMSTNCHSSSTLTYNKAY